MFVDKKISEFSDHEKNDLPPTHAPPIPLGVEQVYFLVNRCFPCLQLLDISTGYAKSICWSTGDSNLQYLQVATRLGSPYQLLGPLLFLLYINDLPDNLSTSVRLFADDCILYTPIRTQNDSSLLQNDLLKLQKWQDTWLIKFNPDKCYTMTLATRTPTSNMYTFCGQTLTSVTSHCYLGIHLSNTLNWINQTKVASTKAQQTLSVIRRNLNKCPTHIKAVAYTSLVRPILEYASAAWDPHSQNNINTLERIQRQPARFCKCDRVFIVPSRWRHCYNDDTVFFNYFTFIYSFVLLGHELYYIMLLLVSYCIFPVQWFRTPLHGIVYPSTPRHVSVRSSWSTLLYQMSWTTSLTIMYYLTDSTALELVAAVSRNFFH